MKVIDSSIALAWAFDDAATPYTDEVLKQVAREGMLVPALFHLEVGSGLIFGLRRGRIDLQQIRAYLSRLGKLRIEVDPRTHEEALTRTLDLAWVHGLTLYDAAYLELALREGVQLATQNRDLLGVAARLGLQYQP